MPCHQHGKQVGEVEGVVMIVPVGVVPLVPSVPFRGLLPPLPPCGFSVTAVENNTEHHDSRLFVHVDTVKPLITDPPKSRQLLYRTDHLPPIDFTTELIHFKPPRSGHLSTPNNGH